MIWGEVAIDPDGCPMCNLVTVSRDQMSKSLEKTFAYLFSCILGFIINYLPQTIHGTLPSCHFPWLPRTSAAASAAIARWVFAAVMA